MLRLANNAITSFSYVPLQMATYFGFTLAGLSLVGIVLAVVLRLTGSQAFAGQATTLVAVPVIIFFLLVQSRMSSGLVGGAVKG